MRSRDAQPFVHLGRHGHKTVGWTPQAEQVIAGQDISRGITKQLEGNEGGIPPSNSPRLKYKIGDPILKAQRRPWTTEGVSQRRTGVRRVRFHDEPLKVTYPKEEYADTDTTIGTIVEGSDSEQEHDTEQQQRHFY